MTIPEFDNMLRFNTLNDDFPQFTIFKSGVRLVHGYSSNSGSSMYLRCYLAVNNKDIGMNLKRKYSEKMGLYQHVALLLQQKKPVLKSKPRGKHIF